MQRAAVQRSRHISPGDTLGKYAVIRQIAVGGMAELYLARTVGIEGFEKLVVVKRILPQYVNNASFVEMFLNEARLAATLHHPNVAQVYDIGLEAGDYFFAMEYVHGEDLDHVATASEEQGVPISMDAALTLVAGLCAGLHYAHEKASPDGKPLMIVHRDVSPSNVIVSYDGAVKLVDFGIARASSRPGTTEGGLKGKIAYMSPEQCRAKATLDRRSDIYAVGTILYQLTTGSLPFSGETEYAVLNQIVNDDVPPPSRIVPGYPPALEQIVLRALARDPVKRFTTARDLQSAIEDFAHEARMRVSPLVLARLMGTLFPTRLEEWDQAKAQGAFFVEQQVVRTLIESGRAADRPTNRARAVSAGDDEPTLATDRDSIQYLGDTTANASPIATLDSGAQPVVTSTPPRPVPTVQMRGQSPTPQAPPAAIPVTPQPQMYPVYGGGTLVSSSGVGPSLGVVEAQIAQQHEVTERVRVPSRRMATPTTFVRRRDARAPWLMIAGGLVVAGGVAAFIAMRGTGESGAAMDSATEKRAPTVERPAPAAGPAVAEEPAKVEPAPEPATVDPAPEPAKVEAAAPTPESAAEATPEPAPEPAPVATPEPTRATKPVKATKPVAKRPRAKASKPVDKATETKPGWNADSPFMPVRTEKK